MLILKPPFNTKDNFVQKINYRNNILQLSLSNEQLFKRVDIIVRSNKTGSVYVNKKFITKIKNQITLTYKNNDFYYSKRFLNLKKANNRITITNCSEIQFKFHEYDCSFCCGEDFTNYVKNLCIKAFSGGDNEFAKKYRYEFH